MVRLKTETKECGNCRKSFEAALKEVKRGYGLFCSRSCSSKHLQIVRRLPNATCAYCIKCFYRRPSKKDTGKSGLLFCCREHKDLAQRIGGIKEIQPPHYGEVLKTYRVAAFRVYPHKCNRCGYDEVVEALEVHHRDRNRENNTIENLEIICPTCHVVEHLGPRDCSEWSSPLHGEFQQGSNPWGSTN